SESSGIFVAIRLNGVTHLVFGDRQTHFSALTFIVVTQFYLS
ncbi:MAG: hypothetical protein ACI9UH_000831, partial [Gammaproteobacteria bacterium]